MEDSHFNVDKRLEQFIEHFVKYFESKLRLYHLIYEGEVKKAGKLSDTLTGPAGLAVLGALGGIALAPFGMSAAGAAAAKKAGKTLAEKLGHKWHERKATELIEQIDEFTRNKSNLRQKLVEAAFDVFQSFEMQFMRVTSEQGPKRAIQLLAQDASNRAINHIQQNQGAIKSEGVLLGDSKIEPVLGIHIGSIKTTKIKTPGFEITYKYESSEEKWRTASLYEKAGLVMEGKSVGGVTRYDYYDKKENGRALKYGCRRLLASESWHELKDKYTASTSTIKAEFQNYRYKLSSTNSAQIIQDILEKINLDDESLSEERIMQLLKEVKDEFMEAFQDLSSNGYNTEDRKVMTDILKNLETLNVGAYLDQFKHYFEEIGKSIEASRADLNQFRQKQDIENKKFQEGINKILETLEDESVYFQVRAPIPYFTGRSLELNGLHEALQSEEGTPRTAAITGPAGVGKSELARKYAHDHRDDYSRNVVWINAQTKATLKKSFQELAHKLENPNKELNVIGKFIGWGDITSTVKDVYRYFKDTRSLFVFDNAEQYKDIKEYLPSYFSDNERPYILITSRNPELGAGVPRRIEIIKLEKFSQEEAVEFIKKALREDNSSDEEARELAEKLHYFPLALRQATAYITVINATRGTRGGKKYRVTDYLRYYEEEKQKTALLSFGGVRIIDLFTTLTVFTTWKIAVQNIAQKGETGQQALEVLEILAYFSPVVSIKTYFSKLESDEEKLWDAFELLKKYSMISAERGVSSIHRLLQEVIRIDIVNRNKEENVLRKAIMLVEGSGDNAHVSSIWSCAAKHSPLVHQMYVRLGSCTETYAHMFIDSLIVAGIFEPQYN